MTKIKVEEIKKYITSGEFDSNDYCLYCPKYRDDKLYNEIEDLVCEVANSALVTDNLDDLISMMKSVQVFEKDCAHITVNWLYDTLEDYFEDNYGDEFSDGPELLDHKEMKQFVDNWNNIQSVYKQGNFVGYLDCSEDLIEELREGVK